MPVAPRIVTDVSYVIWINHDIHFAWQGQYLLKLEAAFVAPRLVNYVSYVMRINHELLCSTGVVLCSTR